jgi:uncharacterized cupin superfamily protein
MRLLRIFVIYWKKSRKGTVFRSLASLSGERTKNAEEPFMREIKVEHEPSEERLTQLGVANWPEWSCEPSVFKWSYDETETAYFLEGEVVVTPRGGKGVCLGKGDLAIFPAGMTCTWKVRKAVKKYYLYG